MPTLVSTSLHNPLPLRSKFATVMMAITGEAFLAAGRHVTDLLLRHFLNAFASTIWCARAWGWLLEWSSPFGRRPGWVQPAA